jgi:FKBP-type peptidyl-prolyl cis-trans isomerase
VHDVKRGTGLAARPGDSILADYIEATYTRGREFFLAWGGEPWPTEIMFLREENIMRGLIIGLRGMRVGGRRRIIVPRRLSDIHDSDRPDSYYQIVYYDLVLRQIISHAPPQ